jgi:hypothetical protein
MNAQSMFWLTLTGTLITLKLFGMLTLSWWVILIPVYAWFALILIGLLALIAVALLAEKTVNPVDSKRSLN